MELYPDGRHESREALLPRAADLPLADEVEVGLVAVARAVVGEAMQAVEVVGEAVAGTGNRPVRMLPPSARLPVDDILGTVLYNYNNVASPAAHVTSLSFPTSFAYHQSRRDHLRFLPPFFPDAALPPRPLSARACPSSRTCSNNFVFEENSSEHTLQACYEEDMDH